MSDDKCIYCGRLADVKPIEEPFIRYAVKCSSCGNYVYTDAAKAATNPDIPKDKNKLLSYLYYNGKVAHALSDDDGFRNFIGTEAEFKYRQELDAKCAHVTDAIVNNWYPKSFNEKINKILVGLAQRSSSFGQSIPLSINEAVSCLFLKKYDDEGNEIDNNEILRQIRFICDYITQNEYADINIYSSHLPFPYQIILSPKGWQRVDDVQKEENQNSKYVFVAMSFKTEMHTVRDAIKAAITESHFIPRIMDEIEHNHQIVPEMLSEIRKSRFVIAELTGHNNGAYYEAGYALGFGKEVIHICNKDQFGQDGHFDVKQVNTVLWDTEEELKDKLIKRIEATIN